MIMKRLRFGLVLTTLSMTPVCVRADDTTEPTADRTDESAQVSESVGRVTGIGGLFFKSDQPRELVAWYSKHLGITSDAGGFVSFRWRQLDDPEQGGFTAWGAFPHDTSYFEPSAKPFMFNYRVDDLRGILKRLESEGIEIVGEVEEYEYGAFGWIMDPEGTKVELWQPPDDPIPLPRPESADAEAEKAVRAALESYYESFSARNWDAFAEHFHDGAVMATRWVPPGAGAHEMMMSTVPEFIAQAAEGPGSQPIFEERMTGAEVRVSDDLATAWVRYEARFGSEENLVEWAGIDAVTLIRFEGRWKIVSLAFTAEL
jgi:predicted enzyme related to lactoylglutathione lyase